jgi:TusA-related sulfurtransferase
VTGDREAASLPVVAVDCLGAYCPVPVLRLAAAVKSAAAGQVVELLVDDPTAKVDIPVWCRGNDHDFLGREDAGPAEPPRAKPAWVLRVRKAR